MNRKDIIIKILQSIYDSKPMLNYMDFDEPLTLDEYGKILEEMIEKRLVEKVHVIRGGTDNNIQGTNREYAEITDIGLEHLNKTK